MWKIENDNLKKIGDAFHIMISLRNGLKQFHQKKERFFICLFCLCTSIHLILIEHEEVKKNSNSCVRGRTDDRKISTIPSNIETNRFQFISPYRVIQQSHPVCNTIMLFGVITCLVSVILLGIDGQFVDPSTYPKVRHNIINKN